MAAISKPFTFSAGAVVIASQHNSNFDTVYNLVNGALDGTNLASNAAIADTQLATISTAGKISGTAITSGNIAIVNTATTTVPLTITASSLTSANLASLYSNSADTTSRTLLLITNDNSAASGTKAISIQQDAANHSITIVNTHAGSDALDITSSGTTTNQIIISANSLTTGGVAYLYSNSSDATSRNLVSIVNDHASADGATCLAIQQDGDAAALYIDYNATVSDTLTGIRIDGCAVANASNNVSITNVAPAGVGTSTISGWLVINVDGANKYIPYWT